MDNINNLNLQIEANKEKILVTGAAGFIGSHLCLKLLNQGFQVIGFDNLNDYYDVNLKFDRLNLLGIGEKTFTHNQSIQSKNYKNFKFVYGDLTNFSEITHLFKLYNFDFVINLAAQAGVRYSIQNPSVYTQSNLIGFQNILEACKLNKIKHLIYASTSSVYGLNNKLPFKESNSTDFPISYYAATKKANEVMAHSYSHLFGLPTTGLRFFTVYGPWGRPDMALFLFAKSMMLNQPITVFNNGDMIRDFTYIDDIVHSIFLLLHKPLINSNNVNNDSDINQFVPYNIFNIGNSSPIKLMDYISALEIALNKKANFNFQNMQPGDVHATHADTTKLQNYISFTPSTPMSVGVKKFADWFLSYNKCI
jgi:UDP-glucuronate 4-epimerase